MTEKILAGFPALMDADVISTHYLEILSFLPVTALMALLAILVHLDDTLRPGQRKTLRIIILVVAGLIVQNFLDYRLSVGPGHWLFRTLVDIYGYATRPVILALFLRLIAPEKKMGWVWALIGVNAALHMTALLPDVTICFRISADNHYLSGPLTNLCLIISGILLLQLLIWTLLIFRSTVRREGLLLILVILLILTGILLDGSVGVFSQPITFLTLAIVISCMMYYSWLHLQFGREQKRAMQAEQRIQIMMTQIQPHFLFNTIATFRALCRKDPEKAADLAERFGDYLRQNLDSLGTAGLIPFHKELEHTKTYTQIEMVRFRNLRVVYDIHESDFEIPPLTVQPMVENAIRHGARAGREETITVTAGKGAKGYEVVIRDNGIGFDPQRQGALDGAGHHIGIANVRERIESMCGGSLSIDSAPGKGTKVTITVPVHG